MSKRSHRDEERGIEEEEMIFTFDEDGESKFTSLASFETRASNPRRITFDSVEANLRPPNPVAGLLRDNEDDDEDDDDDDDDLRGFCPKLLRSISAPPPRHSGGLTPPATDMFSCDGPEPFDSCGRRKRKCLDDTAIGAAGRIRPLAKRAKSFSLGRDTAALKQDYPVMFGSPALTSSMRSDSISIPRSVAVRGSRARSRSGGSNGMSAGGGDAGSSHSHSSSSPSWNATASSLEYFCRRSLDVSSPLRLRFRDLMVGSVGRAASYTGP